MSVDYYIACQACKVGIHVAQDGLSGFTFYSGQEGTMKLLGTFLSVHVLCETGSVRLLSESFMDEWDYRCLDSDGNPLPDD